MTREAGLEVPLAKGGWTAGPGGFASLQGAQRRGNLSLKIEKVHATYYSQNPMGGRCFNEHFSTPTNFFIWLERRPLPRFLAKVCCLYEHAARLKDFFCCQERMAAGIAKLFQGRSDADRRKKIQSGGVASETAVLRI